MIIISHGNFNPFLFETMEPSDDSSLEISGEESLIRMIVDNLSHDGY